MRWFHVSRALFVLVAGLLLVAVLLRYEEYGRSAGYFLTLVFPFIAIVAGGLSRLFGKKWCLCLPVFWLVVAAGLCWGKWYELSGLLPLMCVYLLISLLAGMSFQSKMVARAEA